METCAGSSEVGVRRVDFDCSAHWAGGPQPKQLLLLHGTQKLLLLLLLVIDVTLVSVRVVVEVVVESKAGAPRPLPVCFACDFLPVGSLDKLWNPFKLLSLNTANVF